MGHTKKQGALNMINRVLGKSPLPQTLTPSTDNFSLDILRSETNPFDPISDKKAFKKWEKRSDKVKKADKRQQKRVDDRDFRQERRRNRIEQTGGSKIGNWQRDKIRASEDLNAIFDAPKFIDGKEISREDELKNLKKMAGAGQNNTTNSNNNTGVASTNNLGGTNYNPNESSSGGSSGGGNTGGDPHIRVAGDYYKRKEYKDIVLGGSGGTPTQWT